jgi:glycine betaine/proline transport system substrate-binding protein
MRQHGTVLAVGISLLALLAAACSDVEEPEGGGGGGGGTPPANANVAQCGDDTIVLAVNPWIGAKANAAVAQVLMEQQMGCTVELEDPIAEKAQFPAMADGDVDATLEVWPSGHADDYAQFIDEAGTVVDGGLLGITGNIGWFVPSYVVEQNPQYATVDGFKEDADIFATADTGDKGRFLGADTTYSIFDEQIIAALGLDLEVVYSGSEDASLSALDTAVQNEEPILMYWWTPQWANAKYDLVEVKLPAFTEKCADIALNDPEAVGYNCDYADDVLYKAFSAQLEGKDPAAFEFLSNFEWTEEDQNSVALAIQEGAEPEEAAQEWVDANQDVWQAWLPAA